MTLINAMRTDVPVVDPHSTLAAAASRFAETGCCSLAVLEQGRLVGALDALEVAARAVTVSSTQDARAWRTSCGANP